MLKRLSELIPINSLLMSVDYDIRIPVADLANFILVKNASNGNDVVVKFENNTTIVNFTNIDNLKDLLRKWLESSEYIKKFSALRDRVDRIAEALAIPLRVIVIQNLQESKPRLEIEITHITEREKLAGEIAKQILKEFKIKTFYVTGSKEHVVDMYCFNGIIYEPCEARVRKRIQELANQSEDLYHKTTSWVVNEALRKVRDSTLESLHYEPLTIAFKNVLFDWEKFLQGMSIKASTIEPSENIIVFHYIPHRLAYEKLDSIQGLDKYNQVPTTTLEEIAEKLCPKSLKAFRDWVNDKWVLLFEIIGYTLYPRYDLHKAIMLVGDGSNGKSTFLRLVKTILGPRNVSSIALQDLVDPEKRFTIAELYHKLANIYADLPSTALRETGKFKILTGEDAITVDRKFKDPITFVNYAKLIFSANELPEVHDTTHAFWRRWIVVEFPNRFEKDPTFFDRTFTEDEIEGIILVSLLAFRNAWLRRKFSFEESEQDYRELWLRKTNSIYAFISDLLSGKLEETLGVKGYRDPNSKEDRDYVYNLYTAYCDLEEREALSKRDFTIEMEKLGFKLVRTARNRYYKGLRIERVSKA